MEGLDLVSHRYDQLKSSAGAWPTALAKPRGAIAGAQLDEVRRRLRCRRHYAAGGRRPLLQSGRAPPLLRKKTDVRLFDNCHDGDRGRPIARPGGPEPPSPSTCPLADLLGTPPLPTGRDNNCARAQDTAGALHTRIALLLTVCTAGVCPEVRPGQRPELRTSIRMFVCLYPCRRMFVGRETSLLPSSAPRGAAGDKNQTANAALP